MPNSKQLEALTFLIKSITGQETLQHLIQTPERILKSYENIFSGYKINKEEIIGNNFSNAENNEIILFDKIDFFSTCEHHLIPFFGQIQIAYIANKNAIGFGKIAELVLSITRKLQLQERITSEVANIIQNSHLNPLGVFVKIEASHFCIIAKEKTWKVFHCRDFGSSKGVE